MDSNKAGFATIDEYIATFPEDVQAKLEKMRATIRAAAPEAVEKISYQMPTFWQQGNLVHFAAWKEHIGLYPAASGIAAFQEDLSKYNHAKGSVQFPFAKPLPVTLIKKIVKFRVAENLEKAARKSRKKSR